ncbi:unnamed protein product [Boreogadus saida]
MQGGGGRRVKEEGEGVALSSLRPRGKRLGSTASCSGQHRGGGPSAAGSGEREAGLEWETIAGNNPFLLHVGVHVLQGVKAKAPFPQFLSTTSEAEKGEVASPLMTTYGEKAEQNA